MRTKSSTPTLLIVEDEDDIRELLVRSFQREGYETLDASSGTRGLELAKSGRADLMVLDLMLPGMSGLDVARELQKDPDTEKLPILMLTARGEESDVVLGLELGADDYVTKPFSPRALVARVRALLRRIERDTAPPKNAGRRVEVEDLVVDADRFEVVSNGERIDVTRSEFRLLWTFVSRPGRVFTRGELVDRITDGETVILDRNVDVHMSALRKKLGVAGDVLQTVRGVGYRMRD